VGGGGGASHPPAPRGPLPAPPAGPAGRPAVGPESAADLQLSPVVRRLVEELGVDLDDLAAFADSPRVSRKVIDAYLEQRGPAETAPAADDGGQVIPFNRVRKVIAERMPASKATSAHVVTAVEVDFETVAGVRQEHRDRLAERGVRLTWLPFVARAVARTLGDFERLNSSVRDGEGLLVHPAVHLGIAVDLDGEGLVVPVVRDAQDLDLVAMAERIQDVAGRARDRKLAPDDVTGGTFTITGQGPHGTLFTAPIINQPQVAILSVDGIRKRPVVVERDGQDEIAAHHTGVLALSWDHRAVDGG
jgi:pyruvate dehydrogenase E2 component (dihydrolipoamide acetyltransferase)